MLEDNEYPIDEKKSLYLLICFDLFNFDSF